MAHSNDEANHLLATKSPHEVIEWALAQSKNPIITTNFRPYEVAILHAVTQLKPDITVVWCDTGYNTKATYAHAEYLIDRLNLNVDLVVPAKTSAHLNAVYGDVPSVDDPRHEAFTEQVKLQPFRRAMDKHQPDLWFTNLRRGQTAFRDSIDVVSHDAQGCMKVSPFYAYSDTQLDSYLAPLGLDNEHDYFDPTKMLAHRECGLHKR